MNSNNYYINNNYKFCYFSYNKFSKKKVICKYYLNGYCKNGDNCEYCHTNNDINIEEEPKEKEECPDYKIGYCENGKKCLFFHKTEKNNFDNIPIIPENYIEKYFNKPINQIFKIFEKKNKVICDLLRKINNLPTIEDDIQINSKPDISLLEEKKQNKIIKFMIKHETKIKKYFLLKCFPSDINIFLEKKKIKLNQTMNEEIAKILKNKNEVKKTIIIFILFDVRKNQLKSAIRIKKNKNFYNEKNVYDIEILINKTIDISEILLDNINNGIDNDLGENFLKLMINFDKYKENYEFLNEKIKYVDKDINYLYDY